MQNNLRHIIDFKNLVIENSSFIEDALKKFFPNKITAPQMPSSSEFAYAAFDSLVSYLLVCSEEQLLIKSRIIAQWCLAAYWTSKVRKDIEISFYTQMIIAKLACNGGRVIAISEDEWKKHMIHWHDNDMNVESAIPSNEELFFYAFPSPINISISFPGELGAEFPCLETLYEEMFTCDHISSDGEKIYLNYRNDRVCFPDAKILVDLMDEKCNLLGIKKELAVDMPISIVRKNELFYFNGCREQDEHQKISYKFTPLFN